MTRIFIYDDYQTIGRFGNFINYDLNRTRTITIEAKVNLLELNDSPILTLDKNRFRRINGTVSVFNEIELDRLKSMYEPHGYILEQVENSHYEDLFTFIYKGDLSKSVNISQESWLDYLKIKRKLNEKKVQPTLG